jgi:hypothetical protein
MEEITDGWSGKIRTGAPPPAPPLANRARRGENPNAPADSAQAAGAPTGREAPPPAPPRSFLAERGGFDDVYTLSRLRGRELGRGASG